MGRRLEGHMGVGWGGADAVDGQEVSQKGLLLAEDPGSAPSTHLSVILVPEDSIPSSGFYEHQLFIWYT